MSYVDDRLRRDHVDYNVEAAKAEHRSSVFIPCSLFDHAGFRSLEEKLGAQAIFVGEEGGTASWVDDHGHLETSYKFRVNRDLSKTPLRDASSDPGLLRKEVAPSMLPLQPDEIVVELYYEGVITIDGVRVVFCSDKPVFVEHQKYLLFVSPVHTVSVAMRMGSIPTFREEAIFKLMPDGDHFQPAYPVAKVRSTTALPNMPMEIMQRTHGSVMGLAALQDRLSR